MRGSAIATRAMIAAITAATFGMNAAMRRLEASASNVANMRTTGVLQGTGPAAYRPVRVEQIAAMTGGGPVAAVRNVSPVWRAAYDPGAAFADADGMVAEPNVDLAGEVLEQATAETALRANLKTFQTMQDMVKRLFELTD